MSAVAGLLRLDGGPVADDLARMSVAMAPYGPDGAGAWSEDGVGLAQRKLVVLPEDRVDRQPLAGASGWTLVADVRLDNRDEVATALGLPAVPRLSDAAVLLASLERWGLQAPTRWIGAFAVVAWHVPSRRLLLARDPLGERPLHIHRGSGFVAVASVPAGLHALHQVPRALDEARLAALLLLLPRDDQPLYGGIDAVPRGTALLIAADGAETATTLWTPSPAGSLDFASDGEAVEAFRARIDEAVRCRLRSVGEVGSHLSAGLDSGCVTATAARMLEAQGRRLQAYTAVPGEGATAPRGRVGDEWPGAAQVAAMYSNIDHHAVRGDAGGVIGAIDATAARADHPPLNPCNVGWVDGIARSARRHGVRVLLTGASGNMTLSYNGEERLSELARAGRPLAWWREAGASVQIGRLSWRGAVYGTIAPWLPRTIYRLIQARRGAVGAASDYSPINPVFAAEIDAEALAAGVGWDMSLRPWSDGWDARLAFLRKAENATLAATHAVGFGIDLRSPAIDRRLVDFCLALDARWYRADGVSKRLFRAAMVDRLPPQTLVHANGRGFQAADWHTHFTAERAAFAAELDRLEASPLARRVLDLPRLRALVDLWPEGGWDRPRIVREYRHMLGRALAVGHFIRRVEGGNA